MRHRPSPFYSRFAGALVVAGFFVCGLSLTTWIYPGLSRNPANAAQPTREFKAPFEVSEACREFINRLPEDVKIGWVTVPEKAGDPSSAPVHTFYYHRPIEGLIPVAMYNGGPSGNSHHFFNQFEDGLNRSGVGMWSVFIDQRGTGCSTPYPKNRSITDYADWGTKGIVADSEAVRKAIGVPRWNLFGQSFGASVVFRYIQDHPDAISVAAAHGNGVLADADKVFKLRFQHQVYVIKEYLKTYPDDVARVRRIFVGRLCGEWNGKKTCGAQYLAKVSQAAMGFKKYWSYLHQLIAAAVDKNRPRALHESVEEHGDPSAPPGVNEAIMAADVGLYDPEHCGWVKAELLRLTGEPTTFALTECFGYEQVTHRMTIERYEATLREAKIARITPAAIRRSLEMNPDLELHLFSGEFDFYVPPPIVSLMAAEVGSRVTYRKIPGEGHESYFTLPVLRTVHPKLDAYLKLQEK